MEKITLRVFITAMLACAVLVIAAIWLGDGENEVLPKMAVTALIVGIASAILWGITVFYRLAVPFLRAFVSIAKD